MECKTEVDKQKAACKNIGIYPEWNVKDYEPLSFNKNDVIGIYPEWNVTRIMVDDDDIQFALEYIQNGM